MRPFTGNDLEARCGAMWEDLAGLMLAAFNRMKDGEQPPPPGSLKRTVRSPHPTGYDPITPGIPLADVVSRSRKAPSSTPTEHRNPGIPGQKSGLLSVPRGQSPVSAFGPARCVPGLLRTREFVHPGPASKCRTGAPLVRPE